MIFAKLSIDTAGQRLFILGGFIASVKYLELQREKLKSGQKNSSVQCARSFLNTTGAKKKQLQKPELMVSISLIASLYVMIAMKKLLYGRDREKRINEDNTMSMNFEKPLTDENQEFLREFIGEDIIALDEKTVLFKTRNVNQQAVSHIAKMVNQVATVEINEPDEIKTLSDGSQYQVTPQGWKKLECEVITGEQVKQAMIAKNITYIDHHNCGGCGSMVFYSRKGEQLYFNPGCGCSARSDPAELRDWEEAAAWINMQSSEEWRTKIAQRFGLE